MCRYCYRQGTTLISLPWPVESPDWSIQVITADAEITALFQFEQELRDFVRQQYSWLFLAEGKPND